MQNGQWRSHQANESKKGKGKVKAYFYNFYGL
jgi:hypothetical protein